MAKQVVHLIIGLAKGGAETVLYNTLKYSEANYKFNHSVISMGEGDYFVEPIQKLGYQVKTLDLRHKPFETFLSIKRMIKKADTLCCWMDHANLIGYILGRRSVKNIIWCIHHSNFDPNYEKKRSLIITKLCAGLSKNVDCIIYAGYRAKMAYENIGFFEKNARVIENGCDLDIYKPDFSAKEAICSEYGITQDSQIVLSVARNHPIKDLPTFIKAYSEIKAKKEKAVAIMCGLDIDEKNTELAEMIRAAGLKVNNDIYLVGRKTDIQRYFSAADVYILHSVSEAFPVTLVEAMACACPSIATDVGDVVMILDSNEYVSNVGDYVDIAKKTIHILSLPETKKIEIGNKNREIAKSRYDIREVTKKYWDIF